MSAEHKHRLDSHDKAIDHLGQRIEGVESTVASMQHEMRGGFKSLNEGRGEVLRQNGEILKKLGELEGSRGPTFAEQMRTGLTLLAIVGSLSAGITYLVKSNVEPSITKIDTEHSHVSQSVARREADERTELRELRQQHRDRVEKTIVDLQQAIEDLKTRVGWRPEVRAERAGR